jgi:fibronectin type 3 domain-containing protein
LTPQYFKAVGDEAAHAIKLHYHLANPGFIGSIAVMRSTSYDDGKYQQVGLAMVYDTVYNDFRIEPGQKYYYYLQMVDKMGRKAVRSAKTFGLYQTKINNFPPRIVKAVLKGNAVLVNWEQSAEKQSGYYVYRSEGVGMPMKRLTTLLTATSYTDTSKLRPGLMYGYAVRSENSSNVESKDSPVAYVQAATVDSILMAPKNFHAILQGQAVRLTWMQMLKFNKYQTGYRITRRADGDKQDVVIRNTYPARFDTFIDSTAVPGITYTYNIETLAGKAHSMQIPSNAIIIKTIPYAQPEGLLAFADVAGITLKWGAINDTRVTRFAIYRYKRGERAKLVATVPSTKNSYIDNAAAKGETWYFYIRSIGKNIAETSDKSNEAFVSF